MGEGGYEACEIVRSRSLTCVTSPSFLQAYIYELRSSSPLHRLTGHSDVVSTVAYHPLRPLVKFEIVYYYYFTRLPVIIQGAVGQV